MKAAVLVKFGKAENAFQIQDIAIPSLKDGQVLIQTEGFGLNYADIMAMQGDYQDCPPLPAIIGYDVVGRVTAIQGDSHGIQVGDRVTALTRFGGYAQFVAAESQACAKISEQLEIGKAMALTTQYSTAYYCIHEIMHLHPNDKVLIHAAAGGVGTALVQMALAIGCEIYGTCGSEEKVAYLKKIGVHHTINYNKQDFYSIIHQAEGKNGLDAVFDAVGGSSAKKGFKLLGSGGTLVLYGAASMTDTSILGKLKMVLGFGLYHPIQFMMGSKGIVGVNMLRIGDDRPLTLKRSLAKVVSLLEDKKIDPTVAKIFTINDLTEALNYLKSRKAIGKVCVLWE